LDSTLAEAHATLGFVRMYYYWDWAGADREFQHALALNPSYATGHEWYGLFLTAMGRYDEALAHERRAQDLDPLSPSIACTTGWVLHYSGRQDDAERELQVALRMDSTFTLGHLYLGRVRGGAGAYGAGAEGQRRRVAGAGRPGTHALAGVAQPRSPLGSAARGPTVPGRSPRSGVAAVRPRGAGSHHNHEEITRRRQSW